MNPTAQTERVRRPLVTLEVSRSYTSGHTLIEVLVALALLATSLAGLGAMSILSYRGTQESMLRTTAIYQAWEMTNRMRGNPMAMKTAAYLTQSASEGDPLQCIDRESVTAKSAALRRCTPWDIAMFDKHEWLQQVADLLPQGKGSIIRKTQTSSLPHCLSSSYEHEEIAEGTYVISLSWRRPHDQGLENPTHPGACLNSEFSPSP